MVKWGSVQVEIHLHEGDVPISEFDELHLLGK